MKKLRPTERAVVTALGIYSPQTIAQLSDATGYTSVGIENALHALELGERVVNDQGRRAVRSYQLLETINKTTKQNRSSYESHR